MNRVQWSERLKKYGRRAAQAGEASSGLVFDPGASVKRDMLLEDHEKLLDEIEALKPPADLVERVRERIEVYRTAAAPFAVEVALLRDVLAYLEARL